MYTKRRDFLGIGAISAAGFLVLRPAGVSAAQKKETRKEDAPAKAGKADATAMKVLPVEDLMREHEALTRILGVFERAENALMAGQDFPMDVVASGAQMVQKMGADYHQRLEEEYVFPRFQDANQMTDLVQTLIDQHQVSRRILQGTLAAAKPETLKDEAARKTLATQLRDFRQMYQAHAAQEDTVLFPAFRQLLTPAEYEQLGEVFERREREQLGENGFAKSVEQIAQLEQKSGLMNLAQLTPRT